MIEFPESTRFDRRIPKKKFYENLSVTPALKRIFTDQIDSIVWRNKFSSDTLNVAKGERVEELEIFHIVLRQKHFDNAVLELIDREIPYHILFLLEFEGEFQVRIGYKEPSSGQAAFKVDAYYQTAWLAWEEFSLSLNGLTLDAVYENFVRQIAGESLATRAGSTTEDLKDAVGRDRQRQKLLKQISVLENKVRREKQFNRQVALNAELNELKINLRNLL